MENAGAHMILIGQFDSPFVRRVAIAMRLYGLSFDHYPWSVFGDAEKIARYNPLMRVPTLVLDGGPDGGEALIESWAILDALEDMADPEKSLMPADAGDRREAHKVCALATGIADKADDGVVPLAAARDTSAFITAAKQHGASPRRRSATTRRRLASMRCDTRKSWR